MLPQHQYDPLNRRPSSLTSMLGSSWSCSRLANSTGGRAAAA
jgi:hypothetical protein